jgi:hypothetical protein
METIGIIPKQPGHASGDSAQRISSWLSLWREREVLLLCHEQQWRSWQIQVVAYRQGAYQFRLIWSHYLYPETDVDRYIRIDSVQSSLSEFNRTMLFQI